MSPQPAKSTSPAATEPGEYSAEERRFLLELAHRAINAALAGADLDIGPVPDTLRAARGAFTTLTLQGQLRGCVGYVFAVKPLFETVAETAVAAAFNDFRFTPVTAQEAPRLRLEISVLSPLQEIDADDVVVGKHGLVITLGARRGLLLPQVAVEHGWDRKTFLEQTCHKAGLPADAYLEGARIEAFTAEVFGEE